MGNIIIKLGNKVKKEVFLRELTSWPSLIFLSMLAMFCGYLVFNDLTLLVFLLIGVLAGVIIVYFCLFEPYQGYFIVLFIAFFAFYPNHLINRNVPLSTLVELLTWFVFLGSFRRKSRLGEAPNTLLHSALSVALIVYSSYHVIQFFNPNMGSRAGYLFIMRKYASFILIYIITYRVINTPEKFRFFMKFWVVMGFLAGAYGCYQQWFGYLPPELAYIKRDPHEYKLMFQGGHLRKFSFLSDVVSFGILAGVICVVMLILGINEKKLSKKALLFFGAIIMFLGMSYSGTRTATIVVPTGMSLYFLITIKNKTTLIAVFTAFLLVLFFLYAPIYNPTINRLRSTFNTDNPSLSVRDHNRHFIQPYIYQHPLGGGLATSGVEGMHYNPQHPLAGFPPDSGLLEIAIEEGWIGLSVSILFYLVIMYQGIYYYFRIRNKEFKLYCVAIVCGILPYIVTQYSQVSIGQVPGIFFFMGTIGVMKRLIEFDKADQTQTEISEGQ